MKVAKVRGIKSQDTDGRLETVTSGFCSECGAVVCKHAKGFDEECPECGAYLEWSGDDDSDSDVDDEEYEIYMARHGSPFDGFEKDYS